ncbi:hypothetical protein INT46_000918 [Mucor plumbeus]|uniref:Uncharacterized protein n=1 Tax=Mucor plumbeus TaxID=97098 RepID=A0A8H7RPG9_9FUNG|nr:hypothetical protein INT46_000918 [Mucor plumbeus]
MKLNQSSNQTYTPQSIPRPLQSDLVKLVDVEALPPPLQQSCSPEVIHISLTEITGGYVYDPVKSQQISQRLMRVMNYIDKCNEKHNQLMTQVTDVRLYYQRIMYS